LCTSVAGRFPEAHHGFWLSCPELLEYDGLVSVQENAVFDVPANGARENYFFYIPAFLDEIVDGIAVVDTDHVLLNDGAIVEDLGNVVRGCTDQFDAALKRLMVRLGSDKRRKERVVDVDEIFGAKGNDKFGGKDLHVACEDDE
jgi:hypothetical protein